MKFNATERSVQGTGASRRLRRAGRVPAIVYGGGQSAASIELDHNEIYHALLKEEFHSSILSMQLGGKKQSVLVRAVQWHPFKPQVLHVDFLRVRSTEVITTKVPLRFLNGDTSPAVRLSSAVISHVLTELDISCLPADLPQFIDVDLGDLESGESRHLSSITLPEGVEYVSRGVEGDPVLAVALAKGGGAGDEDVDVEDEETAAEDDSDTAAE